MQDLRAIVARHGAFWNCEEADRPILRVRPYTPWGVLEIPVRPGLEIPPEGYLEPHMLDPERHFQLVQQNWGSLEPVDGDVFRTLTAYFPVPWLEAICGCPVCYFQSSGAMSARPLPGGWDQAKRVRVRRDDPWLLKLREFYVVLAELAAGRYPLAVAMPMRGPIDLAGALVGAAEVCAALVERPHETHDLLNALTDIWIEVVEEQVALLPRYHGGYGSAEHYGLWVPGTNAMTQNDLSSLISPRIYTEFLVPCDERICASLEYPTIHLHSSGIHVLDAVLTVDGFKAVQVVVDPGPTDPPLLELLPYFREVQASGKALLIDCSRVTQVELSALIETLSPRGLCIRAAVIDNADQSIAAHDGDQSDTAMQG